ncbi:NADH dehydrogenase subunit 6 (mitochondrion) [Oratosquilla oratoria]|uniref:NADH-ubiquinone oxidoreductase chain 6 n=1 Tax=Oratosquilla oratoria TaxID=337810 RepID=D8V059_9CRUS|nr:NADH dehydrogenase subunit 6 [Oratosquilla oratoria]ACT16025.1 NADH dehydrogenase subunit 6 [Oratosquilla oratoria]
MSYILLLYLTSMMFSLIFINLSHPLAMGMMLLLQTLVICAITALMNFYVWFSYILFLIFLGGMLVLFIYITSLASNEMFQFSFKMTMFFAATTMMSFLLLIMDPLLLDFKMASADMSSLMGNSYTSQMVLISNIYSTNTMMTTLFMILYLLLTLIVVVKITYTFLGPLRMLTT